MPASLDNSLNINPMMIPVEEIMIYDISILPHQRGDDGEVDIPGSVSMRVNHVHENSSHTIGRFSLQNLNYDSQEVISGRRFHIAPGNFFDDFMALTPTGDNIHDAIKNALYDGLMARYPELAGSIH